MRRILFALPLLAAGTVFAQAPVTAPPAFTLKHVYPLDQPQVDHLNLRSCPVGMSAEQQGAGATQWIVSLEDSRHPGRVHPGKMGVRVALKVAEDWAFVGAKVAVSYLVSPKGAMLLWGAPSAETRTFDLSAGDDPAVELERSLLLAPGVSVTRVKLLSLTYADGTVWQPSDNSICSVRVSHVLRVATP